MEPKSAYSEGHHGLQETHFYRAKKFDDIKNYMAALPKVTSLGQDYMRRASLGQTFGPPSLRNNSTNLDEKLLNMSLNNYSSSTKMSSYSKQHLSYNGLNNGLDNTINNISIPTYNNHNTTYQSQI